RRSGGAGSRTSGGAGSRTSGGAGSRTSGGAGARTSGGAGSRTSGGAGSRTSGRAGRPMIPIADETPVRRFPVVTLSLIALCVAVFFAIHPTPITPEHLINPGFERADEQELRFLVGNAAIPCEIVKGRPL